MGVDHGHAAAPSLPVQRKYRYWRTFVAGIFDRAPLCPGFYEGFGIHVNTQTVCVFPYILDTYMFHT